MKKLEVEAGANGKSTFSIPAPSDGVSINALQLAANTAESFTIPSGAKFVIFNSTEDFYARYDTTATVPADTTDGTASELNPTIRTLDSRDTISVISESSCKITATFYN